jgi:hypothetical protein
MSREMQLDKLEGGIVHHIHHKAEEKINNREVSINSGTFTVTLASNDHEENIEFLTEKALYILGKLKQEGK